MPGESVRDAAATCSADALRVLRAWPAPDAAQESVRARFVAFVEEHGDSAVDRDLRAGHLTASTVLLDADRGRTLLTLHPLVGQWVQLGGHIEPGETSLAQAAAREAREESGIDDLVLDPVPIGLDIHPVTCRDSRRERGPSTHLDVTFVAIAAPGAEPVISDESLDLAWFDVDDLPVDADSATRRLVAAAVVAAQA